MRLLPVAYDLLNAIRPRRCPYSDGNNGHPNTCEVCGGGGFLYPDPPDVWEAKVQPIFVSTQPEPLDDIVLTMSWKRYCDMTWRVLGVTEDT